MTSKHHLFIVYYFVYNCQTRIFAAAGSLRVSIDLGLVAQGRLSLFVH